MTALFVSKKLYPSFAIMLFHHSLVPSFMYFHPTLNSYETRNIVQVAIDRDT